MTKSRTQAEVWDSISLDLVSIQVNGRIVFINAAGAKMLGALRPSHLIGKQIMDFVHPDYREIAVERARQLAAKQLVICPSEEKWLRLDGTTIDVEVVGMPVDYKGEFAVQLIASQRAGSKLRLPTRTCPPTLRLRRKHY